MYFSRERFRIQIRILEPHIHKKREIKTAQINIENPKTPSQ